MALGVTSVFTAIANFFRLGEALSPALIQWIEAKIPAEKQAVMMRRMRRCKRACKNNKLLSPALITQEVDLAFGDLTTTQRAEITNILISELQPRDLQNYN